ncbi:hypothetical protein C1H46_024096 [Malus baccata]|uniref:Uncharacterized protein n=1 Tax=Malus baccata TaxID=106549 RepID=A0A540LVH7_MALBA|nr:hypothetical protein C1H46_024096 [Malus baccata]
MWKQGNKSKAWNGPQTRWVAFLAVCFTLFLLVFVLSVGNTDQKTSSLLGLPEEKWNSFDSVVKFSPTLEFPNGTEVIWHGKYQIRLKHFFFWLMVAEERLIALHALARKFAVLTISSAGTCWTMGKEIIVVKDIIRWWVEKNKLEKLPLVAMGASSEGYFVSVLATVLKFNSIAIMIAEGVFDQMKIEESYPPTLFMHMPKDIVRQQKTDKHMKILEKKGVDVAEIECMEFPLSPHLLADRIPGLDQSVSAKLFELFRKKGFIDENGCMKNDRRKTRCKEAVRESKIVSLDDHLTPYIQEELNLPFAYHEMTSLHADRMFKWFESHMK